MASFLLSPQPNPASLPFRQKPTQISAIPPRISFYILDYISNIPKISILLFEDLQMPDHTILQSKWNAW